MWPFEVDEEEKQAEGLTPEQQAQVQQSVLEKYRAASDTKDADAVTADASRSRTIANVAQALEGMGRARSVARGAKGVDPRFYEGLKADADKDVADARQHRKDRMDGVLTEDQLGWQDKERGQKEKDWAFQGKEQAQKEKGWSIDDAYNDPSSEQSKAIRSQYARMFPHLTKDPGFEGLSANDIKNGLSDPLKLKEGIESRKAEAHQRSLDREAMLGARRTDKADERAWKEEQKTKEVEEKKKGTLNEIEDRRTNITQNLDILDTMIADKGTWEATGSHNQDLDRLVDQIATDMAKLADPGSVARPAEVELVKANLIRSGFSNSNNTAREVLKNFRAEVDRRAENAYRIRNIESPKAAAPAKNTFHGADLPD